MASASPRRSAVLRQAGIAHIAVPSRVDERSVKADGPRSYAMRLAELKASGIAPRFRDAIVIGADTLVVMDGRIFGKPKDNADARRMLRSLNGRTHSVITGICVIDCMSGMIVVRSAETLVTFRKLSASAIEAYVSSGEPLGKAGAYAIQEKGASLIARINGDFYNVVGLPLPTLLGMLEKLRTRQSRATVARKAASRRFPRTLHT